MNVEIIKFLFAAILSSSVIASIITSLMNGLFSERKTFKENKYKETKENLPTLLEIIEGLSILEQAFIYKGMFCPLIEHRCPELSQKDGNPNDQKMSFAQRGYFFNQIGQKIIKNCRQVIFLIPKKQLPNTLKTCKEIINFLNEKENSESKTRLDYMTSILVTNLSGQPNDDAYLNSLFNQKFYNFYKTLCELRIQLEDEIEKELPYLIDQKYGWKTYLKIATILSIIIGVGYSILIILFNFND